MIDINELLNRLINRFLYFETSNILDYFDNECIIYGSCLIKLLNEINIHMCGKILCV